MVAAEEDILSDTAGFRSQPLRYIVFWGGGGVGMIRNQSAISLRVIHILSVVVVEPNSPMRENAFNLFTGVSCRFPTVQDWISGCTRISSRDIAIQSTSGLCVNSMAMEVQRLPGPDHHLSISPVTLVRSVSLYPKTADITITNGVSSPRGSIPGSTRVSSPRQRYRCRGKSLNRTPVHHELTTARMPGNLLALSPPHLDLRQVRLSSDSADTAPTNHPRTLWFHSPSHSYPAFVSPINTPTPPAPISLY